MKRVFALLCSLVFFAGIPCGCAVQTQSTAKEPIKKAGSPIVVGFSQVGAESEWRVANSESMKSALSEQNGYELIFDDARNEQENQIRAIRTFIQQNVDYIVFSPRVETGWNSILQEARDAKIPVNNIFLFGGASVLVCAALLWLLVRANRAAAAPQPA